MRERDGKGGCDGAALIAGVGDRGMGKGDAMRLRWRLRHLSPAKRRISIYKGTP